MSFIKLDHIDTTTLIALLEECGETELSEQEAKTLDKLRMIRLAQSQKHGSHVRASESRFKRSSEVSQ